MQRPLTWMGLTLVVMLLFSGTVQAADLKIGIIDFQKILDESKAGQAAQASINNRGKQMESDLKAKGSEIEDMKKRLEREVLVMSREMREEKEREFRIKINDFKSMQQNFAKQAREMQVNAMRRIRNDVDEIAAAIGGSEGFALILETKEAGVLYAPQAVNLTDKVIARYDVQYAVKAPAAPKAD